MPIFSGGGGGGGTAVAITHLTTAQLLALKTTPVALTPVPAATVLFAPITISVSYIAGATPFTLDATTALAVTAGSSGHVWESIGLQGLLDSATSLWIVLGDIIGGDPEGAPADGQGLALLASVSGTALTLGNGSCVVTTCYTAVPLT